MIKEQKITEVKTIYQKFCDECGTEIQYRISCLYCKKDLCNKCVGHIHDDGGDYPDYYCKSCWNIGQPYRNKINELELQIYSLNDEWIKKCKHGN